MKTIYIENQKLFYSNLKQRRQKKSYSMNIIKDETRKELTQEDETWKDGKNNLV